MRERYTEAPFSTVGKHFFMKPWPRSVRTPPEGAGLPKKNTVRKVTEHRKRP